MQKDRVEGGQKSLRIIVSVSDTSCMLGTGKLEGASLNPIEKRFLTQGELK